MILKIVAVQPIINNCKRDPQTSKDGFKRKKVASFTSVLENATKSKSINLIC